MTKYIVLRVIDGRLNITTRCTAPTADDAISQALARDVEYPSVYGEGSTRIEYLAYSTSSETYRAIDWRSGIARANLGLLPYSPTDELLANGTPEASKAYRVNAAA